MPQAKDKADQNIPTPARLRLWVALSMLALLLLWALSRIDGLVTLYAHHFFPKVVLGLTSISNLVPFSLAELFLAIGLVLLVVQACRLVRLLGQERSYFLRAIRRASRSLVVVGLSIIGSGYLFWGLNYARSDPLFPVRRNPELTDLAAEKLALEVASYCRQAVEFANRNYRESQGSVDTGDASSPALSGSDLDSAIDAGFFQASRNFRLRLRPDHLSSRSKPVFSSHLMSLLGISGFYFPWTGEANFNRLVPFCDRVHAIAHEKAHQRGITSEDEAGFAGYLAAISSPDPYVRYSGYLFAQVQLLPPLSRSDPDTFLDLVRDRLPGVQRDRETVRVFWQCYEGRPMRISASVNDSYLRLHGVEGGIESYSRAARLLILFARANGGVLTIDR